MTSVMNERSDKASRLYDDAQQFLVGGVNAAARLNPSLGRPFFASRCEGSHVWDQDGKPYLDFNMSHGASLLGHGHPSVRRSIEEALELGIMCSFETVHQVELARKITENIPCAELVRFVSTGTEATWYAVRAARAFTGRDKVIKFEGHFHGYSDALGFSMWPALEVAGPEDRPVSVPQSSGMTAHAADSVIVLPWNNVMALERTLETEGPSIAAVIMEPVNYNSGTIMPQEGYLSRVRELTKQYGIVLIFDEILSGFRTGPGCMQVEFGITPDLCTLGKAIGGGTPLSVFAGRRDVMQTIAPLGRAVHSGTYCAHLIPILAARGFMAEIEAPAFWADLKLKEDFFYRGLRRVFAAVGVSVLVQAFGARFSLLFGLDHEPHNYREVLAADRDSETRFYRAALDRGVYFHFSYHHGFSVAHTMTDLADALDRIEDAARTIHVHQVEKGTGR